MDCVSSRAPPLSDPPWPPDPCLGSKEWIPVINRCSPPKRNLSNVSSSSVTRPVTSAQFDSEEELISAAQQIIRNRLAANDADIPPFAKINEKRHFRRNQRQTYLKLC
ncbi:unnamed protein product, partial [Brassica oleracea]